MWLVDPLDAPTKADGHIVAAYCHERLGPIGAALASAAVRLHRSAAAFGCRARMFKIARRQRDAADDRREAELFRLREILPGPAEEQPVGASEP